MSRVPLLVLPASHVIISLLGFGKADVGEGAFKHDMKWADRVKPSHIRRLYDSARLGIYDVELLQEVGCGLYARSRDVLSVAAAVYKGEVPCPQCGKIVYRPKRRESYLKLEEASRSVARFSCPGCSNLLTWFDCREALRRAPKCFACGRPLTWRYTDSRLRCGYCDKEWSWKQYRQSVARRVRLPCPRCGRILRRPTPALRSSRAARSGDAGSGGEDVTCPRCGAPAVHSGGKLSCRRCGYQRAWRSYRESLRRRSERLLCASCGNSFTWNSYRRQYSSRHLLTGGNKTAFETFVSGWPRCKTPGAKMMQIDALLHAVHGRGALGPMLIEGSTDSVMALLDDLAQRPK